jgi:predicted HTH domain antitoxin
MSTVQVELAAEFFSIANVEDPAPSRSAAKLIALELFRERRISAGKAAELAQVSLDEFLDWSAQRGVPQNYTESDLIEDRAVARELNL